MGKRWGGAEATAARNYWRPIVAGGNCVCPRCNKPIRPHPHLRNHGWEVDHWPIPREFGGRQTLPAHARCNGSAGGKRGAAITNAKRRNGRPTRNQLRNIRGV